ncbi:metallophosphoesterase family protein [Salinibacter sp.]|uniref:metallophosphoesterase family protein n=1 Tax=Salinibacter sp. TaxID=2065818 RepID=UPI0021E72D4F|nr:metallophosphoesterase family protein [Salinibacter sp.]
MGLIAVGDIHGCLESLNALLDRLNPSSDDHLLFVGDYIDRGPDSRGVIDRLLDLRESISCTFLRGNHEAMMIDYLDSGAFSLWRMNGGVSTLQSYLKGEGSEVHIPAAHAEFVRETKLYHETDDFLFVHAGLRPDLTVEENLDRPDEEVLLWERGHLEASGLAWEKPVVCGHTPQPDPISHDKLILIDTGCVYHMKPGMGRLTAVRLPQREFIDVPYADG